MKAFWNWGLTHDLLEEPEEVDEVVLRTLLRGNLLARAHVPQCETRSWRNLIFQGFLGVKLTPFAE